MNNAAMSKVAEAVEPLRAAAVERARQEAQALADRILSQFAADKTIANSPRYGSPDYDTKMQNARLVHSLTSPVRFDASGRELNILEQREAGRAVNQNLVKSFVRKAGEDASVAYTAFIQKLEAKVGECDSAVLSGNHVWSSSLLTVCKGEVKEYWRTQQIINVSKLGRLFNQWPTRKVKG